MKHKLTSSYNLQVGEHSDETHHSLTQETSTKQMKVTMMQPTLRTPVSPIPLLQCFQHTNPFQLTVSKTWTFNLHLHLHLLLPAITMIQLSPLLPLHTHTTLQTTIPLCVVIFIPQPGQHLLNDPIFILLLNPRPSPRAVASNLTSCLSATLSAHPAVNGRLTLANNRCSRPLDSTALIITVNICHLNRRLTFEMPPCCRH